MIRRVVLAVLLSGLSLSASADLDDRAIDEMMPVLSDLVSRSGYGVHRFERGAFLVRENEGTIRCELWPFTNEFQRISTSLPIPPGTVAIAHTHPASKQQPSLHDQIEARRLGIPMLIVSRDTLHMIDSEGAISVTLRGISWRGFADSGTRCAAAPAVPKHRS